MVPLLCCVRRRIGIRGEFLLALALLDFVNAYRLTWPSPETSMTPTGQFLAALAPLPVWGAVWAAVGGLCLVQAFAAHDRWAFAAASALKVGWALLHAAAWLWGVPQAWWSVVIWLGFARVVHTIAKVPEATTPSLPNER
ncbi:hypothetical protein [Nonomuraea wenchangensis]|uniref:Uncharacterized protein n=1 Tax=Nonomuraea wenchangensis TaxID=568860 RepID=A0A1I0ERM3_9ACTN|nr:hypothetical protein [Nonomuraea wenchangensis]SET47880.1 hypothetical protein SAMN05421811_103167 [Nonomuraea wenchangensis]